MPLPDFVVATPAADTGRGEEKNACPAGVLDAGRGGILKLTAADMRADDALPAPDAGSVRGLTDDILFTIASSRASRSSQDC